MEGMIGEIRLFAGNFAPRTWALCQGQLLSIAQNQALFSILGTTYGGDGRTTFALPDLRGRAPIGQGTGPGLSTRNLGARFGEQSVILSQSQMPSHNHTAQLTAPGYKGAVKPLALNGKGSKTTDPSDAFMADASSDIYASTNNVEMGESPVEIAADPTQPGSVAVFNTGGSQPHDNMQPSLVLNYIICMIGVFPSRN